MTAVNGAGATTASSAQTALVPPVLSAAPAVTGTPRAASTLSVSSGSWAGAPAFYAYEWQRCNAGGGACVAIPGATGTSYAGAAADAGSTLVAAVAAGNAGGSTSASSGATAMVPPVSMQAPGTTGTLGQG